MSANERTHLLNDREHGLANRTKSVWKDFRSFIDRGNVMDLAIGVVVGNAFTAIVDSFVSDLFSPLISLVAVANQLPEMFVVLRKGPNFPYKTREEAISDGAVTMNYGNFIGMTINFLIIASFMFVVVRMYERMRKRNEETEVSEITEETATENRLCPFCRQSVPMDATKCCHCTSELNVFD